MIIGLIIGSTVVTLWGIGGIYRHRQEKNKVIYIGEDICTGCKNNE
jgi:hypothetical protein